MLSSSIVAFVDILGLRKAMADAARDGTASDLLDRVSRFVSTWRHALSDRNYFPSEPRCRYWEVRVFSDNFVISHPIEIEDLHGDFEFGSLLSQIALLQIGAIEAGFFVRGGVALGDMYVDRDILFGLPLADAYYAESKLALQPRVVLADSAQQFVMARIAPRPSEHEPYARSLLKGEDGRLFVNYLDGTIQTTGEPPIHEWIEQHSHATEAALSRYAGDSHVYDKYVWVARYHNYWCRENGLEHLMLHDHGDLSVLTLWS
jgi:hypothetical protein